MKKINWILVAIFFVVFNATAQDEISIKEVTQTMSKGDNTGLQSVFKATTTKEVEATIRTFLATYKATITTAETNKSELIADDVMIASISENTIDIHYQMVAAGSDVILTTYYNLGGIWASSAKTPEKYTKVYALTNQLASRILAMTMQKSIDDATAKVKGIETELKGLESDQQKLSAGIESAKKTIANSEKAITENNADLSKLKEQENAKVSDLTKEKEALAKFNLTGLQAQIKILEKDKATAQKLIDKNNKTVAKNQAMITKLQTTNEQLLTQNKTNDATVNNKTSEITYINGTITTNNLVEREKNLAKLEKETEKIKTSQDKVATSTTKSTGSVEESKNIIVSNEKAIAENLKAQESKKAALSNAQAELNKLIETQKKYLSK